MLGVVVYGFIIYQLSRGALELIKIATAEKEEKLRYRLVFGACSALLIVGIANWLIY